jgi:hypothetical protein
MELNFNLKCTHTVQREHSVKLEAGNPADTGERTVILPGEILMGGSAEEAEPGEILMGREHGTNRGEE